MKTKLLTLAVMLVSAQSYGDPAWWVSRGLISTGTPNDYYVINIGQLKNAASLGQAELQARVSGGSGTAIDTLVSGFANADNYNVANIGQLKNVAKPFYDRLFELRLASKYPWTTDTGDDANYNMANIGQLKNLFSFNPSQADTDLDGLPDWWEIQNGLNPTSTPISGLVCWYRFLEGHGSSIVNYAGASYTGQMVNGASTNWVQGQLDGALWFDGVDDYIRIAQTPGIVTQSPFTIASFVYLDASVPDIYPTIVSDLKLCGSYESGYALGFDQPSAGLYGWIGNCSGYSKPIVPDSQFQPFGRWISLVQTYDGTNVLLYANGILYDTIAATYAYRTNSEMWIGRAHIPDNDSSWRGKIDDIRIYSTALSSNQVLGLYGGTDTDGDGISDMDELIAGTNPSISNAPISIVINFPKNGWRNP